MAKAKLLEDIGRMIETRKYLNKLIIIDIEIEKLEFEIFGKKLNFDKWLDFKDWIYIYEKIFKLLESTKTSIKNFKNYFKSETFKLHHSTVEVKITKENLEEGYHKLFNLDDIHNFHLFVMKIQINLAVPVENQKDNELKLCVDEPNLNSHNTKRIPSNEDSNIPDADIKEYFPVFNEMTDADKIPSYKPSKLAVEIETDADKIPSYKPSKLAVENEFEPYSPEPVEKTKIKIIEKAISPKFQPSKDKNQVPQYKASPIVPSSVFDKTQHKNRELRSSRKSKTDMSMDYKKYKKSNDGLEHDRIEPNKHKRAKFEENNSALTKPFEYDNSRKNESKDKKMSEENDPHNNGITKMNWLNKSILNKQFKSTSKISHKSKIKSTKSPALEKKHFGIESFLSTPTKTKLTDEERNILRKNDEKDIKKMLEVTDQIKEIIKPSTIVEYRSLHHIPMDTIKNTYEINKESFEKQFDKYKQKKHKFNEEGLNHMFMHSILDEKELMEMSKFLQNIFEPDNTVPEFTDIFFNLMVPEWVLLLYMDEYKLNRSEAIKYLKDQEESLICSQMESSVMNS